MKDSQNKNNYTIALFVALACVLQISESLIPHPIPGLRLGLANILTLAALVILGFRSALEITLMRTVLSSFITGTFMSPGFILSFSGAVVSTLIMGLLLKLSRRYPGYGFSLIGISIAGAFTHNMIQLLLAYFILIKNSGIFLFFPWLSIGAIVMGYFIGITAGGVCRNLEAPEEKSEEGFYYSGSCTGIKSQYEPGKYFLYRFSGHIKLIALIIISITVLFVTDSLLYFLLFCILISAAVLSRIPLSFLFKKTKRYSFLLLFSLLLPLFFNSGSDSIIAIAHFNLTREGLTNGVFFASRIFILILMSSLLVRTTSPDEITSALTKLLYPLKFTGISPHRIAAILSISWTAIPFIWANVRHVIYSEGLKNKKGLKELISSLSKLIAMLYLETERGGPLWKKV
jgi:heptaprenyl diphosphate synthase